MCYVRKGDNYRAKEYIDKALSVDKEAVTANQIKKELIDFGMYSDNNNMSKKILSIITVLFVIGAVGAGGYSLYRKINNNDLNVQIAEQDIENAENSKQVLNNQENTEEEKTEDAPVSGNEENENKEEGETK